jgi:hypothetical protein
MAKKAAFLFLITVLWKLSTVGQVGSLKPEFISFEVAKPILNNMQGSLPQELQHSPGVTAATWSAWVRGRDREIRRRLDRGEEDTLTNLLRLGVTFTKEKRIYVQDIARYGQNSVVNSRVQKRADDLIQALASPTASEGMLQMRAFVEKKGFSITRATGRKALKKYLLGLLVRWEKEREEITSAGSSHYYQRFEKRGISLDTNLWPDFALDQQLRRMVGEGLLRPGSVSRVAVIGPGLDFVNKDYGNDFYPPQTIQPFAIIDSLLRLGVADSKSLELYTLDISRSVNLHLERARTRASMGQAYAVQLPWISEVPMTQEYVTAFTVYWRALGDQIGAEVAPISPPSGAEGLNLRAVRIRPDVVNRIRALNMNIVLQHLTLAPDQKFDLVIGTNVFVYYGLFEQSLARANLATMVKPGGFVLTNEMLAANVPSNLVEVMRTSLHISWRPHIEDIVFCYRRAE